MIEGCLYIIPNENILETDIFYRKLKSGEKHLPYIQEFCDENNLDYHFTISDSNIAPKVIASDGHLVVKTSKDFMTFSIVYLPDAITNMQKWWLDVNLSMLKDADYLGFSAYNKKDNNFIDIEDYTTALSEIKARYELNSDNKERQRGI